MARHQLSDRFAWFFARINPSSSFEQIAAREYATVKDLFEDPNGHARELQPMCFLQGSYRQQTAIYSINDVDIVVLCALWQGSQGGGGGGRTWSRDDVFATIAAPLLRHGVYRDRVRFHGTSMCIKVDLGIKLEILPIVYRAGNFDPANEPFRLWRPESRQWEDGYARLHQDWLSHKNRTDLTSGNFIPAIKVFKHLRSRHRIDAVSFHLECLLFNLPNTLYAGGPADYIPALLGCVASASAANWYSQRVMTPCGERDIFVGTEWTLASWTAFHQAVVGWAQLAAAARDTPDRTLAVSCWQALLGDAYFPSSVSP
jgi:hypothetical protein